MKPSGWNATCAIPPVVAGPNDFVTDIEISRGPEPQSA